MYYTRFASVVIKACYDETMRQRLSSLWFNSSIALLLAGILATTLHELSHLLAGKLLGLPATLYSNAVEFPPATSINHQIITAATGPLFSLVSGLIILALTSHYGKGFVRLFWMWFGLISAQIGFGYFIIAPFARHGDTGKVLSLLQAPSFVYMVAFVIGVIGTLWLSRTFAKRVVSYTDGTPATMRPFGIYSWLTGTALLVTVYIFAVRNLSDSDQFITLFGVFTSAIFAPMFSFFYKKVTVTHETLRLEVPIIGLIFSFLMIVCVTLFLANGIHL